MRRVMIFICLALMLLLLSSCSNRKVGFDTHQTFTKAYIKLGDTWQYVQVKEWRDFQDGDEVQIVTDYGQVYLTHYSNIVLVNK